LIGSVSFTTSQFPNGGSFSTAWIRLSGIVQDITESRQSEKALLLRGAALEAAANAIVITDIQGNIEWANPAFTKLSGWELTEAIGKNPRALVKSDKHDAAFYRQMWDTINTGNVWQGEVINRRKDGELRTENMTITPVRDGQGKVSHFIAIKQDITDQKAIEAHLLQTQRIEAIGTLASGVAHDLNNILSPILLVAGLLKDTQASASSREMLAMVHASAARGGDIVKQLLAFSRGQKGERVAVQLRHLIKEIAMVVRETFPRNIEFQQDLGKDLWTVTADPTQIHQVLLNLCVNARDAMPKGGRLTIRAANVTLDEKAPAVGPGGRPGTYLAIVVHDTGDGIPPEIKGRIFDPFFTTKPLGAGTGLGLSTVLGVVRSHGGFVAVESTPNEGTAFTVYFPAMVEGSRATPLEPVVPTEHAGLASSANTILVVDDEPAIARASTLLLERYGYRVITAINGQDALMQYIQNRAQVRLVLTDLMMPVMNGIDLVRALRAIDPALRILVTSGLSDTVSTDVLAALGTGELLKKPCDPNLLIATVQQQLTLS
jgi:PAS domain S-box-containing protein